MRNLFLVTSMFVALASGCLGGPPVRAVGDAAMTGEIITGAAKNGGYVCGRIGMLVPGCRSRIPIYADVTSALSQDLVARFLASHPGVEIERD